MRGIFSTATALSTKRRSCCRRRITRDSGSFWEGRKVGKKDGPLVVSAASSWLCITSCFIPPRIKRCWSFISHYFLSLARVVFFVPPHLTSFMLISKRVIVRAHDLMCLLVLSCMNCIHVKNFWINASLGVSVSTTRLRWI